MGSTGHMCNNVRYIMYTHVQDMWHINSSGQEEQNDLQLDETASNKQRFKTMNIIDNMKKTVFTLS